jgi:carboxymethylenebutenolidase
MRSSYVEIPTRDGAMPTFTCAPDESARGGIIVMQEVFGVTSHIESICERLATEGWSACAPAFFHRDGLPVVKYDEPAPGVALMNSLTAGGISTDLEATVDFLNGLGFSDHGIGSVGFCMGGSLSLYFATTHEIGAAATFYGVGIRTGQSGLPPLVDLAPRLRCPWIGFYGADDTRAPQDQVEELRAAAATSSFPSEVIVYENAGHAFHCDARPDRFNSSAASDAWQRMLALFNEHLN